LRRFTHHFKDRPSSAAPLRWAVPNRSPGGIHGQLALRVRPVDPAKDAIGVIVPLPLAIS